MINNNKTFISVILPTYNSKKFLKNSINSVLAQSYKNFELIIVDDCLTNGSFSFISKYLKKDHRGAHNIRFIIYEYIALAYNKFRGRI